jgi:flagellar M-ring protein FliF
MENTLPAPANAALPANVTPLQGAFGPASGAPGIGGRLMTLPARAKWLVALGVVALIGLAVLANNNPQSADYRVLFAQIGERDGGPIIERLQQLGVPYRLADGSGTIMVPAAQVYELRMKLSAQGLPKGSVTGYELLDKPPFGQTQNAEAMAHKRALEGELTRTIQSLNSVQAARVLLAMPQQNGFFREQQKPSASITLTLHPGRTLDASQVAGIVHLVASSVPDLNPKAVSVVDASGSLLSQQDAAGSPQGLDARQTAHLREVEAAHLKRVLQLLEPVVGRENVRATVSADIDFTQTESTAEEFKPNQGDAPAAVSASSVEENAGPGNPVPTGTPGAQSNQPATQATAPVNGASQPLRAAQVGSSGGGTQRKQETRFEVDKKVSITRNATGVVRRLNAAVVVNHRSVTDAKGKTTSQPLPAEELEKLTQLVQQGIGFNQQRGDSVRVINAPFHVQAAPPVEAVPLWKQPEVQQLLRQFALPAAVLLVGLALVFGVMRPALKPALAPPPAPAVAALDAVVANDLALPAPTTLGGDNQVAGALPAPDNERLNQLRDLAKQNPAAVANVLRGWVNGNPSA